jgi:hypothetical protein
MPDPRAPASSDTAVMRPLARSAAALAMVVRDRDIIAATCRRTARQSHTQMMSRGVEGRCRRPCSGPADCNNGLCKNRQSTCRTQRWRALRPLRKCPTYNLPVRGFAGAAHARCSPAHASLTAIARP